jgi:hypothetical protein
MKLTPEQLKKIRSLRDIKDVRKLSVKCGLQDETVRRILRGKGNTSQVTITRIVDFYLKKQEERKELSHKLTDDE